MSFCSHDGYTAKCIRQKIETVVKKRLLTNLVIGTHVADIGAGKMPYREIFTRHGCVYIGCDIAPGSDLLIEENQTIPLSDNSFDGVVSFQVLEHVWNLDWYLSECWRILKPGGWLLLSTHGNWLYHPHPGDYRRWTRTGLERELEIRGFKIQEVHGVIGPLAWTTQFRLLGWWHILRSKGLFGKWLLKVFSALMNIKMGLEDLITPEHVRNDNACVYVVISKKPSLTTGAEE